ncbi:hypothetical protein IQ259_17320 [Fortiea sp. LEGE XX443]|uniref:hypothetical protein n=1 Tax=Fortiea sp. LEGE XX443 TaxID=1828611 RepID=UPI00187EFB3A|nr:hypothetical protein [Fortiea sp. LEGE XX443]MBE9006777.1 hypothetical protein [Fortiea sp. LEGE XX443]
MRLLEHIKTFMLLNKNRCYIALLIFGTIFSTNIKPVIAMPTRPVNTKSVKRNNRRKDEDQEATLSVEQRMISTTGGKIINTMSNPLSNLSTNRISGNYIRNNFNTVNVQRTENNLQSIGYLGMNNVNAELPSNNLARESKAPSQLASIAAVNIPVIRDTNLSVQMNKKLSSPQNLQI